MRLAIEHSTDYAYETSTAFSVQYVRLVPRDDPGQRTLSWHMALPGRSTPWRDGFGNTVYCVVQNHTAQSLHLTVGGEVETSETHGVVPESPADLPPQVYLRATPLTRPDDRIRDFVASLDILRSKGRLNALHGLLGAIHDEVAYQVDELALPSTAADTLARGTGVCQDHAHLFIACCRAWGIPARYVSGYLHTSTADGRHLSTHAWAEALVDHLGWVSFDPSNRQSATPAYVRLAVAFDYTGAAPVTGLKLGGGHEDMQVRVQVEQMANQ